MPCPYCGMPNPAQASFCLNCGRLLVSGVVCATCHTVLPPHARFCFRCGAMVIPPASAQAAAVAATFTAQPAAPLAPISPPASQVPLAPMPTPTAAQEQATQASIAPTVTGRTGPAQPIAETLPTLKYYLPEALFEPLGRRATERDLVQARDHLEALLQTVKTYLPRPVILSPQPVGQPAGGMYRGVFLFGDVSGFTPLSEKLKVLGQAGAERITEIINGLFSQLVRELFAHGGTLLKFGGDALLGLFPAQTDEEMAEAALRAAQAGLAIQRVLQRDEFTAIEVAGAKYALKIKCGISAGPYFAAHIGTPPRPEAGQRGTMAYVTTGQTVNLAEEAEEHANPGEVAMTLATCKLLGDRVQVGSVIKSPDENYRLLLQAPEQVNASVAPSLNETPEGDLIAQITYLTGRLDLLSPYLSTELISRIVTNPKDAKIAPEHRPVTVMFANYRGLSRLVEKMGATQPDLITRHLNDYFVHMAEVVEKYEGTLARMDQYAVGDRLVIFFGAPRAHEDDPVRAAYTALEMQEAARKNFAALRTSTGVYRFEQRIGINTGHLFAGNVGAPDLRQEYTLMGDDINMAARLMSNAGWTEIFISKKTKEYAAAFVELEDKGEIKVKGKEIRIPTFKVLGRRGEVGRTRGLGSKDSPLVDRTDLLDSLKTHGQVFLKGRGQIISLVGNSGLGKSRLLRELKGWLFSQEEAAGVSWIEARALSFSEQMSYWMAGQVMRGLLNVKPDTSEDDLLFALGQRGDELLGDEAMNAVPYLAHMMGLKLGDEWAWVKSEDPKVRQKQTFWAAAAFLTAAAKQRPIVIALDDLHWADEASLMLIERLLQVTDHAPLMFCLIFRAQHDKRCWQMRDVAERDFSHRYTELPLEPLDRALSQEMLNKLLPGAEFRSETLKEILDKAAGNPFYLEEVVRSLIESKAVVQEDGQWRVTNQMAQIAVPDTLHAAIMARIDRLTEDARKALQMASVIGREFRLDLLRSMAQAEAEIDMWMAQLERGGLVRPEEITVDPTYAFPDALVQEVAYEGLLVQSRQQIHRRVGETLETAFGENLEPNCELLAYHFCRSDTPERAIKYLEMASDRAKDKYVYETAIQFQSQLLDIKRQLGDKAGQASALYSMGVMAYELGDYDRAWPWLQDAVTLMKEAQDAKSEGWGVMYLGMVELKRANYTEAAQFHQRAIELARSRQDSYQEGIHLTNLARVTMRLGQYDLALQEFQQSLEMKRQNKDINGQGFALFYQGLVQIYQGCYEKAEASLQGAIEFWKQLTRNERVLSYYEYGMGLLALGRGQFERAEPHLEKACALANKLVLKAEAIENLSALSQAKLGLGKLDQAGELSHQAVKLLATQKDVEEVQQIYLDHYRVLTARQDPAAHEFLQRAFDTMMNRANRIEDDDKRHLYLQQVKVNQDIHACMKVMG